MTDYNAWLIACGLNSQYAIPAARDLMVKLWMVSFVWWLGLAIGNMNGWHEAQSGRAEMSAQASWLPLIAFAWLVVPVSLLLIGRYLGWWQL